LDLSDYDPGMLEIQEWGKECKERAARAEKGSDRVLCG
jgi:hypothetical protein